MRKLKANLTKLIQHAMLSSLRDVFFPSSGLRPPSTPRGRKVSLKHYQQNLVTRMLQCFGCICLTALLMMSLTAFADVNQDISAIDQKIDVIKQSLEDAKSERDDLEKKLEKSELLMSQTALNLHQIHRALKQQITQLDALTKQKIQDETVLKQEQSVLDQQIRSAYILGEQNSLKTLLNQQDANDLSRINHYFYYFNKQRIHAINNLVYTLNQLKQTEAEIFSETKSLQSLQNQEQQKQDDLISEQTTRHLLITKLNAQIDSNQLALAKLNADKERLSNLVNQLQGQQANSSSQTQLPSVAFASMQGQLAWPVSGEIIDHFGQPINDSELTYTGTLIKAPEGQTVHAIYPGTVIFSGWLKGFGLLMIIDHGDGYLSLYARNRTLYEQVGAKVSAGDAIAQVGESGGYDESGLYFEIRHNGEPVDPESWCSNQARSLV